MTFKKKVPENATSESEGAAETIRSKELVIDTRGEKVRRIKDDEELDGEIIDQEGNLNPPEQDTNYHLVTKLARTSITPIPLCEGNTPVRILVPRDHPVYAPYIETFEQNRLAEGSASFDTMLAVTERSEAHARLALIRIDSIKRPTCEAEFAFGAVDDELHIAATVSGNPNEDFVGQRIADLAFGGLRYSRSLGAEHRIMVHATTGNDNVNADVKRRLSQVHTRALSEPEFAQARHIGRSHDKDIYALGRKKEVAVNRGDRCRVFAEKYGRGLLAWSGKAWTELSGFLIELASRIRIILFGKVE